MQIGNRKSTTTPIAFMYIILMMCTLPSGGCSSSSSSSTPVPVPSEQTGQSLMTFTSESFVYYSGGREQDLEIYTGRVTVSTADEKLDQLKTWLETDPLSLQPPEIEELGRKNLALVSLVEGATEGQVLELIERLNESGLVDYATPAFGTEEELILITDAFVVRFLDTYSVDEIEAYIASQGAVIVERDFLWPKCYRLSFTSGNGANVLEMAGTFYESGMVVFAHPDFITYTEPPWQPLMEEDFEAGFPQDAVVYDDNPADGRYYWGRVSSVDYPSLIDDYTEGSYKCWVAASHDPASPDRSPGDVADETYAPNMDAWMIFGPYDLSGSYWSQLRFIYEIDSPPTIQEEDYQTMYPEKGWLIFRVSVDGQNWTGSAMSLSSFKRNRYYIQKECLRDVSGLGNIDGAGQVWFALEFISDEDPTGIADEEHEQLAGVFIDDIKLLLSNTQPAPAVTTDPFSCRQWALHNVGQSGGEPGWDINIEPAWDFIDTIPGIPAIDDENDGIIVAVIDEGVDLNHEDLNVVAGYDATYDPDDPESVDSHGGPNPWDGHGTACAGIIGAKNNGAGIVGVAPGVKIMPVRIASSEKGKPYWTTDSDSAEGILWAANNGAQVLSNSWGGGPGADIIHNAIRDAKNMGCILVFASGNHSQSRPIFPARYEETIAVGAMSPCGERKNWESCDAESWWGSNYGPELDVVAPGVMIPTCDITGDGGYAEDDNFGHSLDYYMSFNGTSSACPHVAGIAALMLTVKPDLSPNAVQEILQTTARDLGDPGFDEETGYGLVDAYAAVTAAHQYGDLSVSQFSAPSPAVVGQAVTATCRITNSAPVPVGPLAVRVYLSTDNQLNANDVMVGETTTTINSGSTNLDLNLLIPAETDPGSYLLIVSVDDDDEVPEVNEANNTFVTGLQVIESAFLVVKPASVNFGTVVTGGGSQVNVELKNEGEGVLGTLVISGITFSGDAIFNNTGYNLIPETPVELETNESTYLGLYFMPETAGTYSGIITITSNDPNAPTTQILLTGVATEPVLHTITASAGSGGSISPPGEVSVLDGTDRTFTITPDDCRSISDVLVDGVSIGAVSSYTFENITADHTISASFGLLTYAIKPSAGTGGRISPSETIMVSCGGSCEFTIAPDEHYHIANVLVDGVSIGAQPSYTFSSVDSTHTIQAIFAIDTHTLTVINAGTGIGTTTPSAGFHEYDYGTVVNLSASPAASSTFAGWSGDIESGDIVTMDGDKSVTATFTLKTFTITATAGENGGISPGGSTTVSYGGNQVYTFTPDTGYEVDTVTVDGQATAITGNSYTFGNVTDNHMIDVTFKVLVEETIWSKTYGGTDVEEYPEQIIATDDGGYAFVADTRSFGDTSGDIWFVKLDASGAIEMEKGLGGDDIEHGSSVIQTSDSGYLVAGRSYSYRTGSRFDDIWLVKLDSAGAVQWQRTYGDTGYDAPIEVRETRDESGDPTGYIVAGYTTSDGAGGYDAWVLKLDLTGGIEWQKTYGGPGYESGRSIQATADGGFIMVCDTMSFGAGDRDIWVLKLSGTGTVEWEETLGGPGEDMPESIQSCADGGFVIGAYTGSFGVGNEGEDRNKNFWVIRLASDGSIEWQYTYGGEDDDYLADLKTSDDGGYTMTGWSYSYTQPYWGDSNDAWVVKLDAFGQIDWQRCYNKPYEDAGEIINAPDWAHSIVQAADGGYAILGLTDTWDYYGRNSDIWVFKVDSLGVLGCDIGMASAASPNDSAEVSVSTAANPYSVSDTADSPVTPAGSVFDTAADVFTQCSQEVQ